MRRSSGQQWYQAAVAGLLHGSTGRDLLKYTPWSRRRILASVPLTPFINFRYTTVSSVLCVVCEKFQPGVLEKRESMGHFHWALPGLGLMDWDRGFATVANN